LIERLRLDHKLASAAFVEQGKPPLPEFPQSLGDLSRPPADRLRDAVAFARSLLPKQGGHRLVWGMFPQAIADRKEYLKLAAALVPFQRVQPSMRGVRVMLRDDPGTASFAPGLASAPRVRLRPADFGPGVVEDGLREDAENEKLSDDDRMNSLFTLASLDYAHNRTTDAVEKFQILLGYYQSTGNQTMQAFVLNGLGDVSHRAGDLERAREWYECAIEPATGSKQPVVMAVVVRNLGDVAYGQRRFADAEQFYDGWDKLAGESLDPDSKARALEKRGLSQEQQGAFDRAVQSFEAAAELSRNTGMPSRLRENLAHLARVRGRMGDSERAAAAEKEMKSLQGQEDVR